MYTTRSGKAPCCAACCKKLCEFIHPSGHPCIRNGMQEIVERCEKRESEGKLKEYRNGVQMFSSLSSLACHFHHIPCTEPYSRALACGNQCISCCGYPCVCTQVSTPLPAPAPRSCSPLPASRYPTPCSPLPSPLPSPLLPPRLTFYHSSLLNTAYFLAHDLRPTFLCTTYSLPQCPLAAQPSPLARLKRRAATPRGATPPLSHLHFPFLLF